MNIAFACPQCSATTQTEITADTPALACAHCNHAQATPEGAFVEGQLTHCLLCGGTELFIRKNFSQRLGIAVIAAGVVISTLFLAYHHHIAAMGTLFAFAALDFVVYFLVGNLLECYRCHAQYREMPGLEKYEPFNLETHERHRQQAIRLKEAERAGHSST